MKTHYFFAFDLGATSGRSMLGSLTDGKLHLEELTRFPNKIIQVLGKNYWDIFALFEELKRGLSVASQKGIDIEAIGIDTWGVDFVYVAEDGTILSLPRSYRDPYTNGIPEEYFRIVPKEEVYNSTGIQIMNFNSLFQLYAAKKENSSALKAAKSILFMPDALSYLLTGKQVCEYTIASTSQLLNPHTKTFENNLLEAIGIPAGLPGTLVMPGSKVGDISPEIQKECGLSATPVIAVAGHDTASAVAAVPAENENFAYLSSGTWSLMGIEVKDPIISDDSYKMNFTNEGGIEGTTRFLKNITGMWILEQCRKEWDAQGKTYTYSEIVAMCDTTQPFRSFIDPDDASFANPGSMLSAITAYCQTTNQQSPQNDAEFIRCIFESLALKYRYVLSCLQKMAPFDIQSLHVIGGGSQNKLLNQMTANSINMPVIAGPSEATAIGNVMMQARGIGLVHSLQEMRSIIRNSVDTETFLPSNSEDWDKAYAAFTQIAQAP